MQASSATAPLTAAAATRTSTPTTLNTRNVYLAERELLPLLDWLLRAFAPHRLSKTIAQLQGGQLSNSRSRNQPTTAQRPSSRRATRSSPDTAPSPTPEAINEDTDITTGRRYAAVLLPCPEGMGYRPATA